MNGHNFNLHSIKLIFTFSTAFLIFSACNKANVEKPESKMEKPENVCNLKSEQLQEIRGFRLGMSREQIEKKFPGLCKPENFNNKMLSIYSLDYSPLENSHSILNCETKDKSKFPEMQGLIDVVLRLNNDNVEGLGIRYDAETDLEFHNPFKRKVSESLGISPFSNWEEKETPIDPSLGSGTRQFSNLLCDRVEVSLITTKVAIGNEKKAIPLLIVKKVEQSAKTTAQTKAEENKRREGFKP